MNIQATKTILCFGDSNTWGQRSDGVRGRYPSSIRWTDQLQRQLGDDYDIIAEGLPSRTTNLEYDAKPGRNGQPYLVSCLSSHSPLDLVVLMLGTNDLKTEFHRSAADIAEALRQLVADCRTYGFTADNTAPKILLLSPIHVNASAKLFSEKYSHNYDRTSEEKSKQLASVIQTVATEEDCSFFDASTVAEPGEDGIHFSEASHMQLAEALALVVHKIV